jgi:hypothetical protein
MESITIKFYKMRPYLYVVLLFLAVIGCSDDPVTGEEDDDSEDTENVINLPDAEDLVESSTFSTTVTVTFSGTSASVTTLPDGITVSQTGSDVTVTSTKEGVEYILTGTTSSGMFKIYSDYKFKLTLNGVDITNSDGPAVNIQSGKRAFVVIKDGTANKLTDGNSYASSGGEDMKGCLFSEGQIIFSGGGSLTVKGNYKHGICSDDYVRVRGNCTISMTGATDGIHTNDYVLIESGNLSITASADGIQCEQGGIEINGGTISIKSADDGLVSNYDGTNTAVNPFVEINGGKLTIAVTGAAAKGINSSGNVDLTGGEISITTSGNALYKNSDISSSAGIKCDQNFTIANQQTQLTISSSGTAGKGINCDGTVVIDNGIISVTTTGKQYVYGMLDSSAKGIKSEGDLTINGGSVSVKTTGGDGSEAIESKSTLTINSGTLEITAYDDCINAAKAMIINGGSTYCYSSNNDGFDSNGPLTITGGICIGSGTQSPEEGFDCDQNTFKITGGVIIGTGGATSTPSSNSSTQRSVVYTTSGTANQIINMQTSAGSSILTYVIPRTLSSMKFLFSSPELGSGSYTIYKGGSVSGGTSFHGYYTGATYSGGTQATTFTASSMVTSIGTQGGGGR